MSGLSLEWSVRGSFLRYVQALPDGVVAAEGGARLGAGTVVFHGGTPTAGGLRFHGSLRVTGHLGSLDVRLDDPELVLDPHGHGLIRVMTGGHRVDIAEFEIHEPNAWPSTGESRTELFTTPTRHGDLLRTDTVRFTADGAWLLGDVYPPGTPAAPLRVFRKINGNMKDVA